MSKNLLALGLLLTTSSVLATSLPPIIISAARTAEQGLDIPASTTIIDREQIERSGARGLAELLRTIPSIHVADGLGDGGTARIDMRGFGSTAQSNVAVLINGRKINPATDQSALYLNSVNLDNVERVEIVEGSAGTLYGNQAVGGLINIVTRAPGSRSRFVDMGVGSYDARELRAGLSEPFGEDAALSLEVHRRDSDNYRERNASRLQRVDARLQLEHSNGSSYVDLQLLDDRIQTPGALFAGELAADRRQAVYAGDYFDTDSRVLRVGTDRRLNEHWRFEGELAVREDHRDFVQSFRGFPGSLSTQDRESTEFTPRLIGRYGGSVITLGMDMLSTDYLLVSAFGVQGNRQDILAWYGQLTHALADGLSVTAGLRHARVDDAIDNAGSPIDLSDEVTVGSLGLVYRPSRAWRLFLRADQNYRFAKVDEHTNVVFGQPVGLRSQTGVSYETGAGYAVGGFDIAARAFRLELDDEISFDASNFNTNINLPESRRNGLSLSAEIGPLRGLSLGAGYEYLDAKITSGVHAGSRVPLVPEHRANLFVRYRPSADWQFRIDLEHVGEQFLGSDFDNGSPPLPDYQVANLVVQRELGDWRFTAKVNNLFDERYSETGAVSFFGDGYNPAPERNAWLGVSYRFGD